MTAAVVVLLSLLLLCELVAVGLLVLASRRRPEPPVVERLLAERLRERFVVTLVSGEAFTGLLEEVDERVLVLVDAAALQGAGTADARAVPVDGQLLLPRPSVAYMQRP